MCPEEVESLVGVLVVGWLERPLPEAVRQDCERLAVSDSLLCYGGWWYVVDYW